MSDNRSPDMMAHPNPEPLAPPRRLRNQASIRRPFLTPEKILVGLTGASLAATLATQGGMGQSVNPDLSPAPLAGQTQTVEGYTKPNLTNIELPAAPEALQNVDEIYTGTYEINKGVNIRTSRALPKGTSDEKAANEIVPWDSIATIENADLNGADRFTARNVEIAYGENPKNGDNDGLWMKFNARLKDGTIKTIYISISPQTHDVVKVKEPGIFTKLNPGKTATEPIRNPNGTSTAIPSSAFNIISVPSQTPRP